MRLNPVLVVGMTIVTSLNCTDSASGSCSFTSLKQQVQSASAIFVGTVDHITKARVPHRGWAGTRYRFRNIQYIRGADSMDSLIVVQFGGPASSVVVDGEFQFESNRRYAVLVTAVRDTIGLHHAPPCWLGPFEVASETPLGPPVVHAHRRGPMVHFDGVHLVAVREERPDEGVTQNGYPLRGAPPGPMRDLLEYADSVYEDALRRGTLIRYPDWEPLRLISVPNEHDPRSRVSEAEFIKTLAGVIAKLESTHRSR